MTKEVLRSIKTSTIKRTTGCGYLYLTLPEDITDYEVVAGWGLGKTGGCPAAQLDGIISLVKMLFKHKDVEEVIKALKNIRCPNQYVLSDDNPQNSYSCADAIARIIEDFYKIKEDKKEEKK